MWYEYKQKNTKTTKWSQVCDCSSLRHSQLCSKEQKLSRTSHCMVSSCSIHRQYIPGACAFPSRFTAQRHHHHHRPHHHHRNCALMRSSLTQHAKDFETSTILCRRVKFLLFLQDWNICDPSFDRLMVTCGISNLNSYLSVRIFGITILKFTPFSQSKGGGSS